jgi:predicted DNA-binding protein
MERMVRKQIYLKPEQEQQLKRKVRETGVSEAEWIRQAIDAQVQVSSPLILDAAAWQAERRFIEEWIARGAAPGKRAWRREDLYEQ